MSRFAQIDAELSKSAINCKLCRALAELADEDVTYIRSLMAQDVTVKGHEHIARVLAAGDVKVSSSTVGKCRTEGHQAA